MSLSLAALTIQVDPCFIQRVNTGKHAQNKNAAKIRKWNVKDQSCIIQGPGVAHILLNTNKHFKTWIFTANYNPSSMSTAQLVRFQKLY